MKHEIKKVCKIVDEITTLLLRDDTDEVDLKIKRTSEETIIYITDYNTSYTKNEINEIKMCLNVQRQHEVEECYWHLVGECDTDSELQVIGSMVDEAELLLKNGNLYITLKRKV
ncbi:hypothetical protein EZV73_08155 [Acidaminobacter sp. JC074]|uniref:hypothetical protein n=1 Tax=Acidaminobacter sp. JC074 TaxID=2530199 RepID=UPI001F0FC4BE|nr:hypothetical protein [Acidaminobacter sp. JC074]MCH4887541.1 hypothetical protein [Acidaminobacter sp. JC074]